MKIVRFLETAKHDGVCYYKGSFIELGDSAASKLIRDGICVKGKPEKDDTVFRLKKRSVEKADKE